MFDKDGIFHDIPEDVYHGLNAFSNSQAKRLLDVPAATQVPFAASDAMSFGTAFHSAILEPEIFSKTYIGMPDFGDLRKTVNKEEKKFFIDSNPCDNYLTAQEMAKITGMKDSIMSHPLMAGIFSEGEAETSIFWKDEQTGIDCKCRIDWIPGKYKMLVDVKTTKDASIRGFDREVRKYRYYMQAPVYMSAYNMFSEFQDRVNMFVFVAVESSPPYRFNPFFISLSGNYGIIGLENWHDAIEKEKRCRELNHWESYNVSDSEIMELIAPGWLK